MNADFRRRILLSVWACLDEAERRPSSVASYCGGWKGGSVANSKTHPINLTIILKNQEDLEK
jgi:hypothetical protein